VAAVCWKCVEDKYLKNIVREKGDPEQCSICDGDQENAFTASDLAELLDPIMQEHFEQGPDVKKFGDNDDEFWEQEGDPLSYHVQIVIGQDLGFEDEIVKALDDNEEVWEPDGEIPFFDSACDYVSKPIRAYAYFEEWNYILEDLKHRRRFFSSAAANFFKGLFDGLDTRKSWNRETRAAQGVVWELPAGSHLFRARIRRSFSLEDAYKEPLKHVGPPPPAQAPAARMNAEGVGIFYGATDCETCLAEVRSALGDEITAITLQTTKPLHILDFTRLEDSYSRLSYFQPDFNEQADKGVFLRRLQRLISQPVVPGRESDYLITQTMAEYLAHVHDKPFDGILFRSVQRAEGINTVLFPDPTGAFPISYVDKSFKLFRTTSIKYTHDEKDVSLMDNGEVWVDSEPDDE
jgi:hypothetical protein